jgi:RNA polymerase sigma-54 factor
MSQLKLQLQQRLKLQQQLRLTPQLQLAMKMLQMNHLELSELIKQEVEQNPLLETGDLGETAPAAERPAAEAGVVRLDGPAPPAGDLAASPDATAGLGVPEGAAAKLKDKDYFQDAWIKYQMDAQDSAYSGESSVNYDPDEESNLEEYVSSKQSLTERLYVQLRESELTGTELKAGEYLIGLIDRNGWLVYDEESVLATLGIARESLERVVSTIQTFDPPGIGGRGPTECLLIQYRARANRNPLVETLIASCLEDLANNRLRQIAARERVTVEEVIDAYKEIKTLDPKPGLHFDVQDRPQYITPDVFVEKPGDTIKVTLNDRYIPQLRINQFYRSQLRAEKVANKATIAYIKEKLNAARFIMESIERRKDTIFRVTKEIFEVQIRFFEEGVKGLRQLTLKKVAEKLGLHESTISRVTTSKWAHTPRGVFQLKFFFSSGTTTDQGEDISSKHIKELVQEIVQGENARAPASDSAIRAQLKARGIDIARRTVTKYREELGIRSSTKRKQFA